MQQRWGTKAVPRRLQLCSQLMKQLLIPFTSNPCPPYPTGMKGSIRQALNPSR